VASRRGWVCRARRQHEFLKRCDGSIRGRLLNPQLPYKLLDLHPLTAVFRSLTRLHSEFVAGFQSRQQLRQSNAQHARDLGQISETDVFLAAFDLAYVSPMEAADVGKLLLGPVFGRSEFVNPFAQLYQ